MATPQKITVPIDAVITWVDSEDSKRQKAIESYLLKNNESTKLKVKSSGKNLQEVKYVVHSILKYAPFIRYIFIVTGKQIPPFLRSSDHISYLKVKLIDHQTIFNKDISFLPTFNSISIETKLYQIPGLAEHFIYFNDDVLLLKQTFATDFFIDGKPVIRGKWKRFKEHIFYKKFQVRKRKPQPSYVLAQEKSAKIIGFEKLFKFHHTPFPMRVSTLKSFFLKNPNLELNNIKHKFRNKEQFLTQGVANHLEIKNNTCIIVQDYQLIHFRHYKKPIHWLKFKLSYLSNRKKKLFLNLQDLDSCPENKMAFIIEWLEKKYKI
ncbi:MAG: hypothetical protein OXE77_12105 [Flavobacteriaceae bacterium]|nr:hypothetical protein [Flavobacteriaceae bacterium]MCY4267366.1 hypothetical protein [Flavobacteriaceae bacterium]MCY4299157.1 hypothetical protein [Flavobacteriaceae bacterium]